MYIYIYIFRHTQVDLSIRCSDSAHCRVRRMSCGVMPLDSCKQTELNVVRGDAPCFRSLQWCWWWQSRLAVDMWTPDSVLSNLSMFGIAHTASHKWCHNVYLYQDGPRLSRRHPSWSPNWPNRKAKGATVEPRETKMEARRIVYKLIRFLQYLQGGSFKFTMYNVIRCAIRASICW